jgi:hypothetical protein
MFFSLFRRWLAIPNKTFVYLISDPYPQYDKNMNCVSCRTNPALLVCIDCRLDLYCSSTCAREEHPCQLAQVLKRGNLPTKELWRSCTQRGILDRLYEESLPLQSCEELLKRRICYSPKAFVYLWNRATDFFVWPHEKEAHLRWLAQMAVTLEHQNATIDENAICNWSTASFERLVVLLPFIAKNASIIASAFKTENLHRFVFCEDELPYLFLYTLLDMVALPFLYHPFYSLRDLVVTRQNSTFFSSFEGPRTLVRPLLCQTWLQAISVSRELRLPRTFTFSSNKSYWQRSRVIFLFYWKRKKTLLKLCSRRNPHLRIHPLPPFQDWSWVS